MRPQPLFVRTAKYLGQTQIDLKRIEMSSTYDRPPGNQFMKNNLTSGPALLDQKPAASVIGRKRPECLTKTMENTSRRDIRMDRRWETK
jgi:hypothetical protein